MVRLSIIVPTIGRDSLYATLAPIFDQMEDEDEVIVVADNSQTGNPKNARKILAMFPTTKGTVVYTECSAENATGYGYGNYQRNLALDMVGGTHVALIDDDDVYTPGALSYFREHACDRPVIFKMEYKNVYCLWKIEGALECGNFGTPCFLIPHVIPMPKFGMHYAGDADYIEEACNRIGDPVWRPEIVANIRPHESR